MNRIFTYAVLFSVFPAVGAVRVRPGNVHLSPEAKADLKEHGLSVERFREMGEMLNDPQKLRDLASLQDDDKYMDDLIGDDDIKGHTQ